MCWVISRPSLVLVALVAAVGFQLRSAIVGVPPVLPAIRDDVHLSFTAAGALTALPVLCLGAAAVPGALLAGRFGARAVVGAGTAALGQAALLRLAPPLPASLYLFSAVMALGAAVAQPAMVAVLRASFPGAVQRATTVFSFALGLGGLAGATLSVRLLAAAGWRGSFVAWGMMALAAGVLWLLAAPARRREARQPGGLRELTRDPAVWDVAAMFGVPNLGYFGPASWVPF